MLDNLTFKVWYKLWQFKHDRSAVTAVEYGVIAGAIVVGIVVLINTVGDEIVADFTELKDEMAK